MELSCLSYLLAFISQVILLLQITISPTSLPDPSQLFPAWLIEQVLSQLLAVLSALAKL
jgi:hypothetical protein